MQSKVLIFQRKDGWRSVKRTILVVGFSGVGRLKVKYPKERGNIVVCENRREGIVRFMPPLVFRRGTLYKVIGGGDISVYPIF